MVNDPDGTASGNDQSPEDLFVPPLQQKMELLKKAVGVENIYDDGGPSEQEDTNADENANAPTPEEEDALARLMQRAGMQKPASNTNPSVYNRNAAVMQELTNDEPLDD